MSSTPISSCTFIRSTYCLLGVIGLGRVAGRGANALVLHLEQIFAVELLVLGVPPVVLAHLLVHQLAKASGGDPRALRHDVAVVVVRRLVLRSGSSRPMPAVATNIPR